MKGKIYFIIRLSKSSSLGRDSLLQLSEAIHCFNMPFSCLDEITWQWDSICLQRECSIPKRARPVGASPSSHAQRAMAARCLCSATVSRIPSKPSSALPATRTACRPVGAAASKDPISAWPLRPFYRTLNWTNIWTCFLFCFPWPLSVSNHCICNKTRCLFRCLRVLCFPLW